jgi:DNA-binding transcriptional MerR regulator/methylmalonyl-CoA mutase cobalamin-binding subunit
VYNTMPTRAAPSDHLPIRVMSELTGVHPVTLRAWERRYGLIKPHRTATGHRLYNAGHVELVRRVVALTEQGIPIGRVREALGAAAAKSTSAADPWGEPIDAMAAAIARFDEEELDHLYDEALAVHPVELVTRRLLLPLLVRLGERWAKVPGAIAEEHFFASYVRSKLGARMLTRMRYASGPRILAACFPGEHHEIGLLLFALEARAAGLRVVLLGADTPLEEVAIAARRGNCDAVIVSMSVDPSPGILDRRLPALVRGAGVPVFVGGGAAARNKSAIAAAGAGTLIGEMEHAVRLIVASLGRKQAR